MDIVLWLLVGIVCGVGVLSNATSLTIFFRQSNKQSVSYWLIALTVVDLSGLLCSPLFVYTWSCTLSDRYNRTTDAHLCDVQLTVQHIVCSMHILLLVGMCTDRYLAITKPESCRVWLTKTKAITSIILVTIVCISFHLPGYAIGIPKLGMPEYQPTANDKTRTRTLETPNTNTGCGTEDFSYTAVPMTITNTMHSDHDFQINQTPKPHKAALSRTYPDVSWTPIRDHVVYRWVYVFGIRHLAMFLLPVLAVAVFLFLLLAQSLAAKRKLSRKRSTKGKYIQTLSYTVVVAGVATLCLICSVPLVLYELLFDWLTVEHTQRTNQIAHRLQIAAYFVLISVNSWIYLMADGKFRKSLSRYIDCRY